MITKILKSFLVSVYFISNAFGLEVSVKQYGNRLEYSI
jgi:hypothetical protein